MKPDLSSVSPAFRTNRQALIFAGLIFLFLSLPVLLFWNGYPSKKSIYAAIPADWGDYQYTYKQIYEDPTDIDILFIGESQMRDGVNTLLIRDNLSKDWHEPKNVLTFGYGWAGEDPKYFLLKDLLSRKHVRLVVMQMPLRVPYSYWPHASSQFLFTLDDWSVLSGLPVQEKLSMYAQAVLGGPRKVLSLVRRDQSGQLKYNCAKFLGQLRWKPSDNQHPAPPLNSVLIPPVVPTTELFYSSHPESFKFFDEPVSEYQMYFLTRTMDLLKQRGVPVVALYLPLKEEERFTIVPERMCWPRIFGSRIDLLGMAPYLLFRNIGEEQSDRLFRNDHHFSVLGSEYFAKAMYGGVAYAYKKAISAK